MNPAIPADQCEITRTVEIDGKPVSLKIRVPIEWIRFLSLSVEEEFAKAEELARAQTEVKPVSVISEDLLANLRANTPSPAATVAFYVPESVPPPPQRTRSRDIRKRLLIAIKQLESALASFVKDLENQP